MTKLDACGNDILYTFACKHALNAWRTWQGAAYRMQTQDWKRLCLTDSCYSMASSDEDTDFIILIRFLLVPLPHLLYHPPILYNDALASRGTKSDATGQEVCFVESASHFFNTWSSPWQHSSLISVMVLVNHALANFKIDYDAVVSVISMELLKHLGLDHVVQLGRTLYEIAMSRNPIGRFHHPFFLYIFPMSVYCTYYFSITCNNTIMFDFLLFLHQLAMIWPCQSDTST